MPDFPIRVEKNGSALRIAEKEACHQGEAVLHAAFPVMIFTWKQHFLQSKRSCVYSADGVGVRAMAFNPIEVSECRFLEIPEPATETKRGPQKLAPWLLLALRRGRAHGQF